MFLEGWTRERVGYDKKSRVRERKRELKHEGR